MYVYTCQHCELIWCKIRASFDFKIISMSSMLLVGSYRCHIGFDSKQKFDVSESSVFEYRITSIQFGVLKHFSPWDIFGLWGIETF